MKRFFGIVSEYLAFLAFRGLEFAVGLLPFGMAGKLGAGLGCLAYWLAPPYRRLARRNFRIAFAGEKSEAEIRGLTRRHFRTLGRNILCSLKFARMRPEAAEALVDFDGREHFENAAAMGKGVVVAIAHLGPWELLAQVSGTIFPGLANGTLYQPLANRFINDLIYRRRGQTGTVLFDRSDGIYKPLNHLRNNGAVGVLIDQHAGDHGIWCPFFGRLASTTNLPALLSLRTGAPIVLVVPLPDGKGRWRMTYWPPFEITASSGGRGAAAADITAALNRHLESAIRETPEEWFWVHNRWKTPKPRLMLAGYRRGLHLRDAEVKNLKPFRLIVRSPNPLGDACMAIPAVRALRNGRPDLHLTILCRENLSPLWSRQPEVDAVLTIPAGASPWKTGRMLRREADFDAAILFPNSLRAALEAWIGGVPRRVGYRGHTRRWLLNQEVPEPKVGPRSHHAETYLRIAAHTGADVADDIGLFQMPVRSNLESEKPVRLGICPGAEYGPAKRWPIERFAAVATQVHRESGCRVSIFGSPGEREIGRQFADAVSFECENRVGETSVEGLIDELRECRVLLTNDTGSMHLAATLGVPTVSIFGSTEPCLTRPIGSNHRIVRRRVECSPCFLRECPLDLRCMREIEPETVAAQVMRLLAD